MNNKVQIANLASLLLLLLLVAICFARTLGSYFLADDFGEIYYVSQICNGHWENLISNFTGNYMQIPSMNVYRPWLLMTLVFDYLIWHANPFGYYLTNLLYFVGDVWLLYFIIARLTKGWGALRSILVSFLTAALFALNPLHCESISWVVGRVDTACCFYYLAALLFFLISRSNNSRRFNVLSVIFYWLALMVKEMAIGLPIMLFFVSLLDMDNKREREATWLQKFKTAFFDTLPFWISIIAYFILRYLALGTLLGGYSGAIGATQSLSALSRWLDKDTWYRLFFPLCYSLYHNQTIYKTLLVICYALISTALLFRLLTKSLSRRWLVFIFIWAATCALPIYRLWGIGYNLEGARFCFFLTMPLSMLPVLLLSPAKADLSETLYKRLSVLSLIALGLLAITFSKLAYQTNLVWVHAGKEVKALVDAAQGLINNTPAGKQLIVLGIPKQHDGAHLILNGHTYELALNPPFSPQAYAEHFLTFDPILFGPSEFINSTRFKTSLAKTSTNGAFLWNSKDKSFSPIIINKDQNNSYSLDHTGYTFKGQINPLAYDFLEFDFELPEKDMPPTLEFKANWQNAKSSTATKNEDAVDNTADTVVAVKGSKQHARIHLSNYWQWYTAGEISSLSLIAPNIKDIKIENLKLTPADSLMPRLKVEGIKPYTTGVFPYSAQAKLTADASNVANAQSIVLEVSHPDYFFENFSPDKEREAIGNEIISKSKTMIEPLSFLHLGQKGFYQLRAKARNAQNLPVEEYSDPIIIEVK